MNIKFITGWTASNDNKIAAINSIDLALCGQGRPEGSAAGMVPVQLTSGVVVTPVVTVTSNTSTTKRNSRSAVIKVSIPYTALTKDTEGHTVADPSRSGADLSLHVVLALPASAAKDIKGVNGDVSRQAAEAQVAMVHYLLAALLGQQFGDMPYYYVDSPTVGKTMLDGVVAPPPTLGSDSTHEAVDLQAQAPVPSDNVGGFGGAGFDLGAVKIRKDLNSALSRIANGLPALSCADVKVYPTHRNLTES